MEILGFLKPILTVFLLPPANFLILGVVGLVWILSPKRKNKKPGVVLVALCFSLLWVFSCNGFAVLLSEVLLRQYPPVNDEIILRNKVQAVVVLGGGVTPVQPEYGEAQAQPNARERLRYGAHLSQRYQIPMAFTGGIGWAADPKSTIPEGEVSSRIALREYKVPIRWVESGSRDTRENAQRTQEILSLEGINRVAVVTNAWHMPRAERAFQSVGFQVTPAPMGYIQSNQRSVLNWLPSTDGLRNSTLVLRECFGLLFT